MLLSVMATLIYTVNVDIALHIPADWPEVIRLRIAMYVYKRAYIRSSICK